MQSSACKLIATVLLSMLAACATPANPDQIGVPREARKGVAGTTPTHQTDTAKRLRVDIGNGFSVAAPEGSDWRQIKKPATYGRQLPGQRHSLLLFAASGPSGITIDDIRGVGTGPESGDRLAALVERFAEGVYKAGAREWEGGRFGTLDVVNGMTVDLKELAKVSADDRAGMLVCAQWRIRTLDHGSLVDGVPSTLRYVGYGCLELSDMTIAATVGYSERGRAEDLADQAMAEGERFALSLRRGN